MTTSRLLPLAAILLILPGCGGGGGGGHKSTPGVGTIAMFTDFSGAPTARKVRYVVSRFDGVDDTVTVVTKTANAVSGQVRTDLNGLPTGKLHLHGELLDGSGNKLSELDTLVDGDKAAAFVAVAGATPATVDVLPKTGHVSNGESRRFFALPKTSDGQVVFAPAGSLTWTTGNSGIATVTDGRVSGTGEGTTPVNATFGVQGTANVAVTDLVQKKWTVLVYLNAANDLAQFSRTNFNQMEIASGNPDVRTVVQWKTGSEFDVSPPFEGTRRYLVKQDGSTLLEDFQEGIDMGNPSTLADFVKWGRKNFPADRTVLVVWNHGNGWRRSTSVINRGVSYDDEFGTNIQTWELASALGDAHFDILAWDASLMQMLEVADELKDHATYVVGSEESPPGEGYPYSAILGAFRDNPDASTKDLSKSFVDAMLNEPNYTTRKITQSVLDTSKLADLSASVDAFASALLANRGTLTTLVQDVRNQSQSYSPSFGRVYRDLYDVADRIEAGTAANDLKQVAQGVKASIASALVWEGHNANSPGSHGIAIDFSSASNFSAVRSDYANLQLAKTTRWDDWLAVAP